MPFTIHGAISGSTFNDVGGDMNQITGNLTQIFASHGRRTPGEARDTGEAGDENPCSLPPVADDQSAGVFRTQRRVPRHPNRPHGIVDRRYHNVAEESQDPYPKNANPRDGVGAVDNIMSRWLLEDTIPTYLGDHSNISIRAVSSQSNWETGAPLDPFVGSLPNPDSEDMPSNSYSIGGNMTQLQVTSYGESGLDILYRFIAMGATHDSGERFTEPACHPGTRVTVLEQLSAWADDTRLESSILWLHGSAGVGKSAVAQMFAGSCNNGSRLGASFFFKRGDPERGSWHRLFTTVAFQLAHSVPGLLLHVQHAVEANKLVVTQAKELQFQRLIVEPLKQAPVPQLPPILVLDGLDECEDPKIQQDILRLFIDAIHVHQLPIHILIASRPEPHIRGVIETNATFDICRLVELTADETAHEDIRKYLRDEFCRIRAEYFADGIDLGDVWPLPEDLEHLVKKSSGIFIYAATVIRFVGDQYSHPQERLDAVLNLDPESTAPLDDLYTQILSVAQQTDRQLRIMHAFWHRESQLAFYADPEEIDLLLVLPRGTSRLALRGLHSLLKVPPVGTRFSLRHRVGVLHASFADYLGDPRRSKGWCLALPWLHSDFLHCMIRLLASPPPTDSARGFYRQIVNVLPEILRNATPCDQLFNLLRNPVFQSSLFLEDKSRLSWPQRGSVYPNDLIQLWERHQFVCTLTQNLKFSEEECFPTLEYDSLYTELLLGKSDLVSVLSAQAILLPDPHFILRLFDVSYRIFEPFFQFREHLQFPFPAGDSPLDFIADPHRAGPLYMEPRAIAEVLVLRWIARAREFMVAGDFKPYADLLQIMEYCGPSLKILDELATLDLSKICDQISDDQVHKDFHQNILGGYELFCVVDWLQTFPQPPRQVIEFWKNQIKAIEQCDHNYADGSDSEGNE
ncbi:hypothetical protein MVEN_00271100 [Mycena venus]|uniref:Nephrocystin 3-like N-terminal domain-containing protein n=1 Tax=Mycena venus TaxID=2733690 RepID=A0A8H6Z1X6_9AGAR|nr:hypothetical protein MVEN_00271100 [Mycena venus]